MTSKDRVLARERERGRADAKSVQSNADSMSGTELNTAQDRIPDFAKAENNSNMLNRPIGFVCKSSAGRVVKLLQPYDSSIYTQEPEELPAQWGFVWSDNPIHAKPFVAISTSPYMIGNCCTDEGKVWRSKLDNNVWKPVEYPSGWEEVV